MEKSHIILTRRGRSSIGRTLPCQGRGLRVRDPSPALKKNYEAKNAIRHFLFKAMAPGNHLTKGYAPFIILSLSGDVAKWEGKGLQNPDHGFKSRRRL